MSAGVEDENVESCGVVRPRGIPSVILPVRRMHVVFVRCTDEFI